MPTKIGFEVVHNSGEDENFPASDLNRHGFYMRGWRSSANTPFPHYLIIKLETLAVLHQIQLLAHQYLIPEKVEIKISSNWDGEGFETQFEYLGFIRFSDNTASGFRSQELKSVFVSQVQAKYIKLVIPSNHVNAKNIYNQVALVAVNVLGDPVQSSPETNNNFPSSTSRPGLDTYNPLQISPYDDLAFEMYVDQETANIIKELESKKLQAVYEEKFDYANALKITIKNLRAAGEILGLYEQEKKQAINREDYDRAKKKKLQMDNFREKIYTALDVHQFLQLNQVPKKPFEFKVSEEEQTTNGNGTSAKNFRLHNVKFNNNNNNNNINNISNEIIYDKILPPNTQEISVDKLFNSKSPLEKSERCSEFGDQENEDLSSTRSSTVTSYFNSDSSSDNDSFSFKNICDSKCSSKVSGSHSFNTFLHQSTDEQNTFPRKQMFHGHNIKQSNSFSVTSSTQNFFSRNKITMSKSEYKINSKETVRDLSKSTFEAHEDRTLPALKNYSGNEVVRNCQFPLDVSKKSTLNEKEKKQASLPISVFGVEMVEKFYSKNFNDKEEGLKRLQQELRTLANFTNDSDNNKPPPFNKVARAAIFLLHKALKDKVFSVYSLAAETVRLFFIEYVPQRVTASEVGRSVEKILPELLLKSGDLTPRIHNMATHTLLTMAECKEVRSLNIIPVHLSRPLTASIHPRLALSRLEMVEQLILNQGISKEKKSGLSCPTLAEFGSSGMDHPAEPVRKVSERILLEVYKMNPRIVRKQLPPDDNVTRRNLLYRHLFQKFDEIDLKRKMEESQNDSFHDNDFLPVYEITKNNDSFYTQSEETNINLKNGDKNKPSKNLKNYNEKMEILKKKTQPVQSFTKINVNHADEKSNCLDSITGRKETVKNLQKNTKSSQLPNKVPSVVKFPSLVDSIDTTKARMLFNKTTSNSSSKKFEQTEQQLDKDETKPETEISSEPRKYSSTKTSIPLPVGKTLQNFNKNSKLNSIKIENMNSLLRDKQKQTAFKSKLPQKVL